MWPTRAWDSLREIIALLREIRDELKKANVNLYWLDEHAQARHLGDQ